MRDPVKPYFGLLKIQVKFYINLKLEISMQPVCLLMIFLLFTLIYLIISLTNKLIDLIERTFQREGSPYLACNDRNAFFTSEKPKKYHAWSCQNICDALTFLLDNIFIRLGSKLYRQVVGIPISTNRAPLVADLFLSVMKGT